MNLQLSDGTTMQVPDDATPEAIRNFAARGEAHIKANPAPAAAAQPAGGPQGGADPNSFRNVTGRVTSDAVMGIPDMLITAANLITKPGDWVAKKFTGEAPPSRDIPTLAPQLRKEWNVAELPEDAPYWQRIAEGVGSGLPMGAAGIARAGAAGAAAGGVRGAVTGGARELVRNTVLPTVTGDVGARAGGAVGGETGAFIGGLAGGAAPSAPRVAGHMTQERYTGMGKPNAPEIAAAAQTLGIEPTAGALGNAEIQKLENRHVNTSPGGYAQREQARIREQMTGAGEDIAQQRGATGASTAAVGDDIRGAAADRVAEDRTYSSAQQENLQRTVGDDTQVPISDVIRVGLTLMPQQSVPGRESLRYRLERHLYPLINRGPNLPDGTPGAPILDAQGNATVPYGLLKQFRTDLGRSFDQGNYPRAQELYDPTTDAMRTGAARAGVPRAQFDEVQSFTRGVEGEGGLAERMAPYSEREPSQAYNYTLEGGLKNPQRLETFNADTAGDPRQPGIYGNYLQQKIAETLGAGGARGPNNMAAFVENADPRAISTIAGPQEDRLRALATLARGVNVPTSQTGLGRTVGGVGSDLSNRFIGAEAAGQLAGAVIPELQTPVRVGGYALQPALRWLQQRMLQSDAAKRGLTGQPNTVDIPGLLQQLNAIAQSTNNPRGPRR